MQKNQRRKFLKLGAGAVATAGLSLGANPWLTLANAADGNLPQLQGYRSLVCIYLSGGSDGFSLLVPAGQAGFNEYTKSRQNISFERSRFTNIAGTTDNNKTCALCNHAQPLGELYNNGNLAFLANVGNLIEPTTKDQYENQAVQIPVQLFSHSDQEIQWQQLQGRKPSLNGWGAIAAQYLSEQQQRDYLTSVTIAGTNYWQSSDTTRPFSIAQNGLVGYKGMDKPDSNWQKPRIDAFARVMQQEHPHLFKQAYADLQNRASNILTDLGSELDNTGNFATPMPAENELASKLQMVARLVSLQDKLGMSRQIFYVDMQGWDVHDAQLQELPWLFEQLSTAMAYFQSLMEELGQSENVTTFTASDFGRGLNSNGDGTDHGWGNHHMIMGGSVIGGQLYGSMPRMLSEGPDAVRNGRVIPTTSATQYAATLLEWLGLDTEAIDNTLPTLSNFSSRNLNFMV